MGCGAAPLQSYQQAGLRLALAFIFCPVPLATTIPAPGLSLDFALFLYFSEKSSERLDLSHHFGVS